MSDSLLSISRVEMMGSSAVKFNPGSAIITQGDPGDKTVMHC